MCRYLASHLEKNGMTTEMCWAREQITSNEKREQLLDYIDGSNIVVLAAPLYDDCQPYPVVKTMEIVAGGNRDIQSKRLFVLVNCGFAEHRQITAVAIPIYRRFADSVGFVWAGSLALAGGEMLRGAEGLQLDEQGKMLESVRQRLRTIGDALLTGGTYRDDAMVPLPEFFLKPSVVHVMNLLNNRSWKKRAKRNGANVAKRPYEP